MSKETSNPKTANTIRKVLRVLAERNLTRKDFMQELQRFLPKESLPLTESGRIQLSRWLSVDTAKWVMPKPEIVNAFERWLDIN